MEYAATKLWRACNYEKRVFKNQYEKDVLKWVIQIPLSQILSGGYKISKSHLRPSVFLPSKLKVFPCVSSKMQPLSGKNCFKINAKKVVQLTNNGRYNRQMISKKVWTRQKARRSKLASTPMQFSKHFLVSRGYIGPSVIDR